MDSQTENTPEQHIEILLDTNILQYFLTDNIRPDLDKFLKDLVDKNKVQYCISQVTISELLSGANLKQEDKALEQIQILKQYNIDQGVLIAAARLRYLYKVENIPDEQIELEL